MDNEMEKRDNIGFYWLIGFVLVAITTFGVICIVSDRKLDGVTLVLTFLCGSGTTLLNFKYGSSSGSKAKDTRLANSTPIPPVAPDASSVTKTSTETITQTPAPDDNNIKK